MNETFIPSEYDVDTLEHHTWIIPSNTISLTQLNPRVSGRRRLYRRRNRIFIID